MCGPTSASTEAQEASGGHVGHDSNLHGAELAGADRCTGSRGARVHRAGNGGARGPPGACAEGFCNELGLHAAEERHVAFGAGLSDCFEDGQPFGGDGLSVSGLFAIPCFPQMCAEQLLPDSLIQKKTPTMMTWTASTMIDVRTLLANVLTENPKVVGISKSLQKPSERVMRTVATLIPDVELTWLREASGREKL